MLKIDIIFIKGNCSWGKNATIYHLIPTKFKKHRFPADVYKRQILLHEKFGCFELIVIGIMIRKVQRQMVDLKILERMRYCT